MPQHTLLAAATRPAVPLEHRDRRPCPCGVVVVDRAGGEEGHRGLSSGRRAAPRSVEPAREGLAVERRQRAVLVDADHGLHERPGGAERPCPVGQRRRQAAEAPTARCCRGSGPAGSRPPAWPRGLARAQHQPREVDLPAVRRRVGAVVVAELALVAEVHDLPARRRPAASRRRRPPRPCRGGRT